LRYRGGTLAELWRALRTLKALQAEAAQLKSAVAPAPRALPEPREMPIEPERRGNPRDSDGSSNRVDPAGGDQGAAHTWLPPELPATAGPAPSAAPFEPARAYPDEPAPPRIATEIAARATAALLAGTALVPLGRRR
jgi:hypothetical protein